MLASAGHAARLVGEQAGGSAVGGDRARVVAVLSDFYLARLEDSEFAPAPATGPDAETSAIPTS